MASLSASSSFPSKTAFSSVATLFMCDAEDDDDDDDDEDDAVVGVVLKMK